MTHVRMAWPLGKLHAGVGETKGTGERTCGRQGALRAGPTGKRQPARRRGQRVTVPLAGGVTQGDKWWFRDRHGGPAVRDVWAVRVVKVRAEMLCVVVVMVVKWERRRD